MYQELKKPLSTAFALALAAGTAITFFAIDRGCPLNMEGGSSGFKLQVEQCSDHDVAQVNPLPPSGRSEAKRVDGD